MGHTGLEPCVKTTGNKPLCEEGGAESGAVVADEVLGHLVANWQEWLVLESLLARSPVADDK